MIIHAKRFLITFLLSIWIIPGFSLAQIKNKKGYENGCYWYVHESQSVVTGRSTRFLFLKTYQAVSEGMANTIAAKIKAQGNTAHIAQVCKTGKVTGI